MRIINVFSRKMKSIKSYLFLLLVIMLGPCSGFAQSDAKFLAGVDFDTYFYNSEYSGMAIGKSQTLFSSRLTPKIGLEWEQKNQLVVAMVLWSNFGQNDVTFDKVRPQIYYRFNSEKVSAYAGVFSREEMIGDYSDLFLSDSTRFYDNRVQGLMGQYRGQRGHVELSLDWCGMFSAEAREKFRILSSGRYYLDNYHKRFYAGYAFQMFHYAGSEQIHDGVVDNIIIDPFVGARFNAYFDFDLKLHYIHTLQRDRGAGEKMRSPKGAMLQAKISKWGVYLDEELYVGDNLQPYYSTSQHVGFESGYGSDLYAGERFFGTEGGVYNSTKIGYAGAFFNRTVNVNTYIAMQYDGYKWGTKQVVQLSVKLLKDIGLTKKK